MRRPCRWLLGLLVAGYAVVGHAQSLDDAKAMVEAALALDRAVGHEAAIHDFVAGNPKWRKGSMYLVAVDFTGLMLAHAVNSKIVGKNMLEVRDAAGKLFIQEVIREVRATGAALVDLAWTNPETKKIDDAVIYAKRLNGMDAYVGAVYFKHK